MRKLLFASFLCAYTSFVHGQNIPNLIAHWDMNGTTNDVSGNGFNGSSNDITPAAGHDGVMGHGYFFNGETSVITYPYGNALNVANYSISATVKPAAFFHSSPCHSNTIFTRGSNSYDKYGDYFLLYTDWPAGYGCSPTVDSAEESFMTLVTADGFQLQPPSMDSFNAAPYIAADEWYKVVVTFNDTTYKTYVNNVLVATATITNPGTPIGTSSDSGSIGMNIFDAPEGYPYNFTGTIDDIGVYNRAITPCEVSKIYYEVDNLILQNPVNDTAAANSIAFFSITAAENAGTATFQWQVNTGSGYVDISDAGSYSGSGTTLLTINPVLYYMNNYQYRCIRNGGTCVDTSAAALLDTRTTIPGQSNLFQNSGVNQPGKGTGATGTLAVNSVTIQDQISVAPNPAKNIVNIQSPVFISKVEVTNMLGQVISLHEGDSKEMAIDIHDLAPGVYVLKVNNTYTKKVIKE